MKKLDRNRPFGEIWGSCSVPNARYTQAGAYFNAAGDEVGVPRAAVVVPPAPVPPPAVVPMPVPKKS